MLVIDCDSRGGRLVLFELTEPDAMKTNFAFGLLPGWWRGKPNHLSQSMVLN